LLTSLAPAAAYVVTSDGKELAYDCSIAAENDLAIAEIFGTTGVVVWGTLLYSANGERKLPEGTGFGTCEVCGATCIPVVQMVDGPGDDSDSAVRFVGPACVAYAAETYGWAF
jgi:hypothetical protein